MKFIDFEFIPLMLLPSFILLYLVLTNKSVIERVFASEVLHRLKLDQGLSKQFRITLLFLALFSMILAMARPVIQRGVVEVTNKKADLVIALDISRSMKAKDYYPDRLRFAKEKIKNFIKASQYLQIGIIAFAKDAFIVSPITGDKDSLLYLLDRLDTDLLSLQGTNIMAALKSAKLLFGEQKRKNLLILTDGGDKQDFSDEIAYAKKEHFRIFILGVATQKGAPIPQNGHFLKDKKGNIVITRLNTKIATLAKKSQGLFLQARLDNQDIKEILRLLQGDLHTVKNEKIVDQLELYPYFLIFALIFLFLAFFSIPQKRVAIILLCISFHHLHAGVLDFQKIKKAKEAYSAKHYKEAVKYFQEVAKSKRSPQSFYDLGNAYYKAKMYKKAIQAYNRVQTSDKELEFRKLHNLGNCYFRLKNYKKAIQMYEKALKIKKDPDTQFNLELAKKMLQQKKSSSKKRQKSEKKSKKKEQKRGNESRNSEAKKKKQQEEGKKREPSKQSGKARKKPAPITDREEKKWLKRVEQNPSRTLLYKAPIKIKKEASNENPW